MREQSSWLVTTIVISVSLVHLTPMVGVFGAESLYKLYGIYFEDPNLLILMQHRAVLFGVLGSLMMYSLWRPEWQRLVLLIALTSTLSFALLCWLIGDFNGALFKLLKVDLLAATGAFIALLMTVSSS